MHHHQPRVLACAGKRTTVSGCRWLNEKYNSSKRHRSSQTIQRQLRVHQCFSSPLFSPLLVSATIPWRTTPRTRTRTRTIPRRGCWWGGTGVRKGPRGQSVRPHDVLGEPFVVLLVRPVQEDENKVEAGEQGCAHLCLWGEGRVRRRLVRALRRA